VFTAEHTQFGLIVAKLEAVRAPSGPTLARITEDVRPQVTVALFRDIGMAARKAARTEIKTRIYPDKARAALGLPPLKQEKAPATTGKAEKAK